MLSHSYIFCDKPTSAVQIVAYRFARLWPLQVFAALVTWLARFFVMRDESMRLKPEAGTLFAELTLLNGLGLPFPEDMNNFPSWTVSCEFWLSVPFACLVTRTTPPAILVIGTLIGQVVLFDSARSLAPRTGVMGLIRCGSSFLLGAASYSLHRRLQGWPALQPQACEGTAKLVHTVLELVLSVLTITFFAEHLRYASSHDFAAPWLFAIVVLCFAREEGLLSQFLCNLELLGLISYSVYLNHTALEWCLFRSPPDVLRPIVSNIANSQPRAIAVLWGLLLPCSYATYCLVEKPSLRLLRNAADRLNGGFFTKAAGFDGRWLNRGVIIGSTFMSVAGLAGKLAVTGTNTIAMLYEGVVTHGELRDDGNLYWDDGDMWLRAPVD